MNIKEQGIKKILLFGGSGMVGRNIKDVLYEGKYSVYSPNRSELDLNDLTSTEKYINKIKPDLVIHAAGKVGGIQANTKFPVNFLIENIDISKNIILSSKKAGVKRLLNLGSSCMYPRNIEIPMHEDMILKGELEPTNEGYALAKIVAAKLCNYISKEDFRFNYKTIIPCNLYGKYDCFSPERSHLVPSIIFKLEKAIKENLSTVSIWGDGTAKREFMYAGDLSEAIKIFIDDFDMQPPIMNIGCSKDHKIKDYYEIAAEIIGFKGIFKYDLSKPVGMRRKKVNIQKQKNWGWMPKTDLKEGIRLSYDYYIESIKNEI